MHIFVLSFIDTSCGLSGRPFSAEVASTSSRLKSAEAWSRGKSWNQHKLTTTDMAKSHGERLFDTSPQIT